MERHHPNICPDCEELAASGGRCAHCGSGRRRGEPVPPPIDPEWEALREMVGREFREVRLATEDGGQFLISEQGLSADCFAFADEEEEAKVWEVFERPESKPLLSFLWDGFGPMSSSLTLFATDLDDLGHLVFGVCDLWAAFCGLVRAGDGPAIWSALIIDLVEGGFLFGGSPSEIDNDRPDLIPAAAVQEAMRRWLDAQGMAEWVRLREQTIARIKEPNPLVRSSARLAQFLALCIDGFQDAQEPAVEELSEADRATILENYFRLAYQG
jgi:hypothetical protein